MRANELCITDIGVVVTPKRKRSLFYTYYLLIFRWAYRTAKKIRTERLSEHGHNFL